VSEWREGRREKYTNALMSARPSMKL
jgi:hypothetical protein